MDEMDLLLLRSRALTSDAFMTRERQRLDARDAAQGGRWRPPVKGRPPRPLDGGGEVWPDASRARPVADYTRSQLGTPIMRSQVTGMPAPAPAATCDPRVLARRVQLTGDF
jgi:hypothetical protein